MHLEAVESWKVSEEGDELLVFLGGCDARKLLIDVDALRHHY